MLRLERCSTVDDLTLGLRVRQKWLTKELVQGLALALLLHVGAFALFSIHVTHVPNEIVVRKSIVVADRGARLSATGRLGVIEETQAGLLPYQAIAPTPLTPHLPTLAITTPSFSALPIQSPKGATFENFSRGALGWYLPLPTHELFALRFTPLRVQVADSLPPLEWEAPILWQTIRVRRSPTQQFSTRFEVVVEGNNGAVCWTQLTHHSGDKQIDDLATQFVQTLTFSRVQNQAVARGEVEISFELDEELARIDCYNLEDLNTLSNPPACCDDQGHVQEHCPSPSQNPFELTYHQSLPGCNNPSGPARICCHNKEDLNALSNPPACCDDQSPAPSQQLQHCPLPSGDEKGETV